MLGSVWRYVSLTFAGYGCPLRTRPTVFISLWWFLIDTMCVASENNIASI